MSYRAMEGCKRLCFDASHWQRVGHDVGDNSMFWKPVTVKRVYFDRGDWLAEVEWEDGLVTRGHFASGLKDA
jgi:hypothetical protein